MSKRSLLLNTECKMKYWISIDSCYIKGLLYCGLFCSTCWKSWQSLSLLTSISPPLYIQHYTSWYSTPKQRHRYLTGPHSPQFSIFFFSFDWCWMFLKYASKGEEEVRMSNEVLVHRDSLLFLFLLQVQYSQKSKALYNGHHTHTKKNANLRRQEKGQSQWLTTSKWAASSIMYARLINHYCTLYMTHSDF